MSVQIIQGDCLEVMRKMPDQSVDLVFDSPPYEDARTYRIDFKLRGEEWVNWMFERTIEALRICRGLVATVVEGKTRQFQYSATPILLMADLHRHGIDLRKPPIFHRVGIPGSGGPDWLRSDYEWIVCCTNGGKLPWSNNTACGHPPKWAPGGAMSNRLTDGVRVNRLERGNEKCSPASQPKLANPGNAIQQTYTADEVAALLDEAGDVTHHIVGGGVMGNRLCHENEAPFPESLAEFFIKSFCPPGGTVLDRFSGSGTTAAVANRLGRNAIGIDIRESQVELAARRLAS